MLRRLIGSLLTFGAGFAGVLAAVATAADEPKPVDWAAWVPVGVWTGEVNRMSKDGKGFRLKTPNAAAPGPNGKAVAKTVELSYADGALARWAKLPPKLDEKGKPVARTAAELADARKPAGWKGFAAEWADVKVGQTVEVTLVRPKELAAKDVQFSDYRMKMVVITGENPNAATDPAKDKAKAKAKEKN